MEIFSRSNFDLTNINFVFVRKENSSGYITVFSFSALVCKMIYKQISGCHARPRLSVMFLDGIDHETLDGGPVY